MASATDMLRAKCCGILMSRTSSTPVSLPKKTTSMPWSSMPASWSTGANGVPAQGVTDGTREKREPIIAGAFQRERDVLARAGFQVVERQRQGLLDQTADSQPPGRGIEDRLVIVRDREELVVGGEPTVQGFPMQLLADHV